MRRNRVRWRHGFVTICVVILIALVSVAIGAESAYISAATRSTRDAAMEAQLRQMLLAGNAALAEKLRSPETPEISQWSLELPPELAGHGGLVHVAVEKIDANEVMGSVRVELEGRKSHESLHFGHFATGWGLEEAALSQ